MHDEFLRRIPPDVLMRVPPQISIEDGYTDVYWYTQSKVILLTFHANKFPVYCIRENGNNRLQNKTLCKGELRSDNDAQYLIAEISTLTG